MTEESEKPSEDLERKTPEELQKSEVIEGFPVVLSDGQTWKLGFALLSRALTDIRDTLALAQYGDGEVFVHDVVAAAVALLRLNYAISQKHASSLCRLDDEGTRKLAHAVGVCVVGPDLERMRKTYTEWMRSALLSNAIDPASLRNTDVPGILLQLIETKRAMPPEDFISETRHARRMAELMIST